MFEDQQKTAVGAPPSNLPTEPVDMFAGVEEKQPQAPGQRPFQPPTPAPRPASAPASSPDALSAGLLKKKEDEMNIKTPPVMPGETEEGETSGYKMKGPMLGKAVLIIFVLAALGLGGWWVYARVFKSGNGLVETPNLPAVVPAAVPETNQSEQVEVIIPTTTEEQTPAPVATTTVTATPSQSTNDSILFGESTDTDSDGLDDSRERDLGTDPAGQDSDGDGLSDGDEVIIWKTNPLNSDTDGDSHSDGKEVRNLYNPLGPGKLFSPTTTATTTL